MVDVSLLKQLENSLNLYQENQETLNDVVRNAQFIFGDDWMEKLPTAFDNVQMDTPGKILLKDKANHAVHYYGALTAWQEALTYLETPSSVTLEVLTERISVLEYWLTLFGKDGADLIEKVKELYVQLKQKVDIEEDAEEALRQKEKAPLDNLQKEEEEIAIETSEEEISQNTLPSFDEKNGQIILNTSTSPVSSFSSLEEEPFPTEVKSNVPDDLDSTIQVMPENFRQPLPQESTETVQEDENVLTEIEESILPQPAIAQVPNSTEEQLVQTIQKETIETQPITQEKKWEDKSTAGEMSLEDLIDFTTIPEEKIKHHSVEEVIDAREAMEGSSFMVSQNWDFGSFLRQKRLYDDANNWLSAWCIRMDKTEKLDYPHYGFIVDIMYDLKEKIQTVLENQLLEELVEQQIPGGRQAIERLSQSIEKELEDLPDDYKLPTSEKIKLNARDILGAMDLSEEKEFMEAAPDGFELMDDPYTTSTDQILSDFEKTEEEVQNQLDKLNVIEENKQ